MSDSAEIEGLRERCRELEKREEATREQVCKLAEAVGRLAALTEYDAAMLLEYVGLCGRRNVETGTRCGLPAGHKETIHSSGRLPKQEREEEKADE